MKKFFVVLMLLVFCVMAAAAAAPSPTIETLFQTTVLQDVDTLVRLTPVSHYNHVNAKAKSIEPDNVAEMACVGVFKYNESYGDLNVVFQFPSVFTNEQEITVTFYGINNEWTFIPTVDIEGYLVILMPVQVLAALSQTSGLMVVRAIPLNTETDENI